jgi:prepilin-type N-terminal cleavage/methylation domain-containing protein
MAGKVREPISEIGSEAMSAAQRFRALEGCHPLKTVCAVKHKRATSSAPFERAGETPALPGRAGFTLIEIMVVVVLIGILSAMILPEMKGGFGDALLRSSGRELVNVFELAYSHSVSLNQIHVVRFEESTGRYAVERRVPSRGNQPEFAPLKDVGGSSGKLDERIRLKVRPSADNEGANERSSDSPRMDDRQTPGVVSFYPDGTADAVEVLLRDRAGYGLRLQIDPITARIKLEEVTREQGE